LDLVATPGRCVRDACSGDASSESAGVEGGKELDDRRGRDLAKPAGAGSSLLSLPRKNRGEPTMRKLIDVLFLAAVLLLIWFLMIAPGLN
jgi:hypothetical protein